MIVVEGAMMHRIRMSQRKWIGNRPMLKEDLLLRMVIEGKVKRREEDEDR